MASPILSPLRAFELHSFFFSPFSLLLSPHAINISDKVPQRDPIPLRSSLNSPHLVSNERNPPHRKQRKNGSPQMGHSRLSSSESRNGNKRADSVAVDSYERNPSHYKDRKRRIGSPQMGHSGFSSSSSTSSSKSRNEDKRVDSDKKKSSKKSKKTKVGSEEVGFRVKLDMCSKGGDVMGAISLYDSALEEGIKLGQYHYNVLLYLCSSAAIGVIHPAKSGSSASGSNGYDRDYSSDEDSDNGLSSKSQLSAPVNGSISSSIHVSDDVRVYARARGLEIYEHMRSQNILMSEAALTSVARIAMSMGNGDMAFEMVKQMKELGITPRLRSYGPSIFAFCNNGDVDKAFEVEKDMLESGVSIEEPELRALLKASSNARKGGNVYYVMHKLRTNVRQVSPLTADLIEDWFKSSTASRVGKRKFDESMVKKAMENGGGGWHGLGWLGKGKWEVLRTNVDDHGVCMGCGEKLVTIDLDPIETENFAASVASIASKRERNSSFQKFQRWLDYYGPFEAVVDAANVGLFSQRQFSLIKVNAVVNAIRQKLPTRKWPLIIVHNRRLLGRKMGQPLNEKLIEKWKNADAIYATPTGSNDDWYWLYAAIKCKSLIVTNDEMRDHVFQILGNDFFPKWKERHQESEKGHWHIPISEEHGSSQERTWLCVTRVRSHVASQDSSIPLEEARREKETKRSASDAQYSSGPRRISHSSKPRNKRFIGECHKPPAYIKSPNFHTILSDIEAAEKIAGCVIDFQI
ncbi:proteinaceous RNase P 1, chloroplastic/mitochondrial-like isoform X2 [Asparagus officinalis]|uniref:proteinaceous RNase P 1, chloroplastic/mitochondrial-like isoform X2 n=1 Tax=Asparagus officinalis TaxID=4686 RepID=UPI00098E8341|nr:proteinaceous RNase P 1, chloroplastic/mitochondrial-like isoform X2 [Asparagus officinalis]